MFLRCLSTVEAGLAKQREELRNGQIPKQEALGVRAVGQERLDGDITSADVWLTNEIIRR